MWVEFLLLSIVGVLNSIAIVILAFALRRLSNISGSIYEVATNDNQSESAIADSSPQHLRAKREERYRKGEPLEDEDSQIVNTKTAAQRQAEANAAKEKKLDKWMPGVKRA